MSGAGTPALRWLTGQREVALAVLLLILLLLIGLRAPQYLALGNLDNVLINASVLVMLAVAQLMVILTRGIDLSQAAMLAFTGMLLALLSQAFPEMPATAFLILAATVGVGLGAISGFFVAIVRIPPIIVTLGTLSVYRGTIFLLSGGKWVSAHEMSAPFKAFPLDQALLLPNIILVAAIVALLAYVFLGHMRLGRAIYAVGGSPLAARYIGISVPRTEFMVYCLSGLIAGLAGYLWTARFAIAFPEAAAGLEFTIIAACVVGGVSISGGRGTVTGVVLGALFISVIQSALPFVRVSPFLQTAISGAIILAAVIINSRAERRRGKLILAPVSTGDVPVRATVPEAAP